MREVTNLQKHPKQFTKYCPSISKACGYLVSPIDFCHCFIVREITFVFSCLLFQQENNARKMNKMFPLKTDPSSKGMKTFCQSFLPYKCNYFL